LIILKKNSKISLFLSRKELIDIINLIFIKQSLHQELANLYVL
jgi:hypothetical protein